MGDVLIHDYDGDSPAVSRAKWVPVSPSHEPGAAGQQAKVSGKHEDETAPNGASRPGGRKPSCGHPFTLATASISTAAPAGSRDTSTVALAGRCVPKCFAYTAFTVWKSSMSTR